MCKGRKFLTRHGNIALYVPNLIGYLRICCSICAFAVAPQRPLCCLALYFWSFVCDELDGRAARAYNQSSSLGAVLDMLTDRLSTTGLLTILCIRLPEMYMLFLALMFIDIFSHWVQMFSTLLAGDTSHKQAHHQSCVVRYYYTHRIFMGICCTSCEILYLAIFLLSWEDFWIWPVLPISVHLPYKLVLRRSGKSLGTEGEKDSSCLPLVLMVAFLAFPGFAIKQIINIVQFRAACKALIHHDLHKGK